MKIKNLNIRKKTIALALAGTLTSATLFTGCNNKQVIDTKKTFNKIIIFDYENKSATICEIKSWIDSESGKYKIQTIDNFWFTTSIYDSKLINDEDSEIKAEDFIMSILGEDAEINYLLTDTKTKTR